MKERRRPLPGGCYCPAAQREVIWNVLLGAFFAVNGGDVVFWIRGTTAPAEFYRTFGYAMSDAEFVRILSLALAFVVPAMAVFAGGMTLRYRTPGQQLEWWTRLPKSGRMATLWGVVEAHSPVGVGSARFARGGTR